MKTKTRHSNFFHMDALDLQKVTSIIKNGLFFSRGVKQLNPTRASQPAMEEATQTSSLLGPVRNTLVPVQQVARWKADGAVAGVSGHMVPQEGFFFFF